MKDVETQREITGGWEESETTVSMLMGFVMMGLPDDAQRDLGQWVDERLQRALHPRILLLHFSVRGTADHLTPEIDTMNELPVVHRSKRIQVLTSFPGSRGSYDIAEMDSEHADEAEGVRVRLVWSEKVELGRGILHEVDRGESMGGRVSQSGE